MSGARSAIWIDGEPQPWDTAHVSVRDRGLTLGDGLFETMRAHGGTVFRLDRHLARLHQGLEVLGIPAPPRIREWVLGAVADVACDGDLAIRLMITRGVGPGGVAPPSQPQPTVVIVVGPLPTFPAAVYESGLRAQIASGRRNERSATIGLKLPAYADAVVALLAAQRAGFDEAVFLDTEGHCSEATSSNVFVWTGDALLTPPLSCAALPGITRATVLQIASSMRIPAAERAFGADLLTGGREAFLTSSLRGIAPLVRVDESPIGDGRPGDLTRRIAFAYSALVLHECTTALSAGA